MRDFCIFVNMGNLTPKQEKFCQEYVKTGNKSGAYRIAYSCENMKEATINNNAYKLFENNDITTRINTLQKKIELDHGVDIAWCIEKLKLVVEDDDKDRVSAIDKLIKHLGGYEIDNKQKSNEVTIFQLPDNKR